MIKKRNVVKIIIFAIVFVAIIIFGFAVVKRRIMHKKETVITTGMTKGQSDFFQGKLSEAFSVQRLIDRGKKLEEEGKYEEAIAVFNEVIAKTKWQGEKGTAVLYIADAYEKKRDYKKALEYVIIDRDEYVNDWAKEPIVERAKYLEYALQGNYEMAVKHAQLAIEADAKLPSRPKTGRQVYIDRLNDLKASKEYIESLKE